MAVTSQVVGHAVHFAQAQPLLLLLLIACALAGAALQHQKGKTHHAACEESESVKKADVKGPKGKWIVGSTIGIIRKCFITIACTMRQW